ncbi:hypothetical protein LCGC14_1002630 [marine sediment metagenome]|uniref:RNA polymerase sigma-70 domain-containing protein n=1 Tax=marine sediment metagenome TaxID=412755 RepID=A0A0F9N2P0_9ZZZZ
MAKRGRPRKIPIKATDVIRTKGQPGEPSSLTMYLREIQKFTHLPKEEELALAKSFVRTKSRKAREKLIVTNLKFVVSIAVKYRNFGLPLEDLIQEGNIGLMISVDKFDPNTNNRIVTYAAYMIRNFILRAIFIQTPSIKLPIRFRAKFIQGGPESEWMRSLYNCRSLDAILGDDETLTLGDLIADTSSPSMETMLDKVLAQETIDRLINNVLTNVQRFIIINRFGLYDCQRLTLEEIGDLLSLSREGVRLKEKRALKKLKVVLAEEKNKYEAFYKPFEKKSKELLASLK